VAVAIKYPKLGLKFNFMNTCMVWAVNRVSHFSTFMSKQCIPITSGQQTSFDCLKRNKEFSGDDDDSDSVNPHDIP